LRRSKFTSTKAVRKMTKVPKLTKQQMTNLKSQQPLNIEEAKVADNTFQIV